MRKRTLLLDIKICLIVVPFLMMISSCNSMQSREPASEKPSEVAGDYNVPVGKGEGLTKIPGTECNKPIDRSWPKVTIHIPNIKTKSKDVNTKSVEIEILSEMNERLKNFTMLKNQNKGTIALRPVMSKGPLKVRVSQNFVWNHGKKKHQIQNVVYEGTVDRENICLNLPEYRTVKANIKLSPDFIKRMKAGKLDLSRGYIEAKNQLGELSVDMKVKYDPSRTTAANIPNIWKTDLLLKTTGGKVTFTPSPWNLDSNEFTRQNSVTVDVSPSQSEITVEINK